jgi:hypothetical protein
MNKFILFAGAILLIATGCNNNSGSYPGAMGGSYQEKVMSIEEIERSNPTDFLSADGTYNQNFFGTKLKVHGIVKNKATVATYKDAVVRITYYSKTKTVLGSKDYTIYDFFPPNSEKNFELKIENYQNVESIGWDVVSAAPSN